MYEPVHVLSKKSTRQHRNVFIWSTATPHRLAFGLHVDEKSPVTVSTLYRWIVDAVRHACDLNRGFRPWEEADSFILFPVEVRPTYVLSYLVHKNGVGLARDCQEIISPGDYGLYSTDPEIYFYFDPVLSFSDMESGTSALAPALFAKTVLTSSLIQQAHERDGQCIFSGALPSDVDLSARWIFPPFMGYRLSLRDDQTMENRYYADPDGCDFSEFMVVENVISCRKDIATLFWENKLAVDVDDNYRIIVFEGSESLTGAPLKAHLMLEDGPNRPSDRFLRLHFRECLIFSASRGDVLEDHRVDKIECFMEELGVYDNEINPNDPGWLTPLGMHVHAYLIRQNMFHRNMDEDE